MDRVEKEQPDLVAELINLYEKIGAENFANYINTLLSIKKHQQEMLLITRHPWQKSIIERISKTNSKESFAVTKVRIISHN